MLLIIYYLSNLQCIMRLQGVLFDLWLNIFWSPKNISSRSWREPKCLKYIEMCVNVIWFLHKIVPYRIEIRNIYFLFERYLLTKGGPLVFLFSHKFAFKTFHFFSYMSLSNHNKCKYSRPCNLWNKLKISVREPSFLTTAKHTPQEFHCSFGIIFQYIFFFQFLSTIFRVYSMCKTYQSEHAAEYSDSFLFISICVIRVVLGFLVLFSFRFRTTSQHHLNRRHLLWMVVFGRGRTDRHSFDQMSEHTFNRVNVMAFNVYGLLLLKYIPQKSFLMLCLP